MKRIVISCVWPVCGLTAFCLWLTAIGPAAAQDTAQLQAELDKSRAVIQQLQAELAKSQALIQQVQAERAALQDEMAKARAVAQNQAAQFQAELEVLRTQIKTQQAELVRLMTRDIVKPPAAKPAADNPPPKIEDLPPRVDGVIRAIAGEMIEISLGSDDGLKKGHRLDIYRVVGDQGVYVGRMELVKTGATASVGKMVPDFQKKEPQKGDRVATRM
jgi:hypothetical protein